MYFVFHTLETFGQHYLIRLFYECEISFHKTFSFTFMSLSSHFFTHCSPAGEERKVPLISVPPTCPASLLAPLRLATAPHGTLPYLALAPQLEYPQNMRTRK